MKKLIILNIFLILTSACANQMRFSGMSAGPNVLSVKVSDFGMCSSNGYINEPCTSITICTPGTNYCQTINDILVDTGSYGLRIFSSAIGISLNPETDLSGNPLGECAQFGTGATWGSVKQAKVILAQEPAVQIPIQVIDHSFGSVPVNCPSPYMSAADAGWNGILGVGLFSNDCLSGCDSIANNGMYFSCQGAICSGSKVAINNQVINPVSALPVDNNGVILQIASVPSNGASTIDGQLILGIGTQPNNMPTATKVFETDANGNFSTLFNGQNYQDQSFIDSGTNGMFFPAISSTPPCSAPYSDFFCPPTAVNLSATMSSRGTQLAVPFQIANALTLFNTGNSVFSNLGGKATDSQGNTINEFVWGLPFFMGRTVYVGIVGKNSPLGSGPYWAL